LLRKRKKADGTRKKRIVRPEKKEKRMLKKKLQTRDALIHTCTQGRDVPKKMVERRDKVYPKRKKKEKKIWFSPQKGGKKLKRGKKGSACFGKKKRLAMKKGWPSCLRGGF